jgi:hypothetical protein
MSPAATARVMTADKEQYAELQTVKAALANAKLGYAMHCPRQQTAPARNYCPYVWRRKLRTSCNTDNTVNGR